MGEQRACEDEGAGRAVAAVGLEYCSDVTTNGEGIRGGKLEDGTSEATASIDGAIERRCDEECCALVLKAAAGMAAASWSVAHLAAGGCAGKTGNGSSFHCNHHKKAKNTRL